MTPKSLLCAFFAFSCILGSIAGSLCKDNILETLCVFGFFFFAISSLNNADNLTQKKEVRSLFSRA
jgi:hypothetical protein